MKIKCLFVVLFNMIVLNINGVGVNGPFLVVNDAHSSGMFATFASVLGSLDKYETENYSGIKVDLRGWLYTEPAIGPNWWEYFFEPIHIGTEPASSYFYINDYQTGNETISRGFRMGRRRANYLIKKYIHIKPEITEEVNQIVKAKFDNKYVIGVHYRGTDKGSEYPLVSFKATKDAIEKCMEDSGRSKKKIALFVATDQAEFLNYMLRIFPNNVVYNDFVRSNSANSTHVGNSFYSSNYLKGREALVDCLVLSRCNVLIRSPCSSFSVMAGRFNLSQPQVIVRSSNDKSKDVYKVSKSDL